VSPWDDEDDMVEGELDDVLFSVLPNMVRGDRLSIHDIDCPAWGDGGCACRPLIVWGPSGKA
jgi:hypothetical protein